MTVTALFFNPILEGYEFTKETATEWGKSFDFSSEEPILQTLSCMDFVDTFEGIEVYYCFGTDSFLFAEIEDLQTELQQS